MAAASRPALGSDSRKQASFSPVQSSSMYLSLSSLLPSRCTAIAPMLQCAPIKLENAALARPSSSRATQEPSSPIPGPPYSSENGRPKSPISFILLVAACGISSVSSTWLPIGQSSFSTNSRIERLRSFKSSGSSKFRPSGLVAIAISISPPSFARNATSGSGEFRAALAEERRDAFLSVVAVEDRQRTLGFRAQSGGNAFVEPDIG